MCVLKSSKLVQIIFVVAMVQSCNWQSSASKMKEIPPFRGMTVSCPMEGRIWTTKAMDEALQSIKQYGNQMVSVHPYAFLRKNGTVLFKPSTIEKYIVASAKKAKAQNLSLFLKPHLGYWGAFSWRGAINFGDNKEAWKRFYEGYEKFILLSAEVAEKQNIPLFAVGVETDHMTQDPFWKDLIIKIRKIYSGALTFAANWDTYTRVPFWEELDYIGIQAYFPMASSKSEPITMQSLKDRWAQHFQNIKRFADGFQKKVIFTEIGYSRGDLAAVEPWKPQFSEKQEDIQRRKKLICAAMNFLEGNPLIIGYLWWKWMPGKVQRDDFDFSMRDPEAVQLMQTLRHGGGCTAYK